ncbi:MAG: alpha/beta fold hydrolase, partial [Deltaproteobacteria bacterium]|nr:alpha/beta fold hydrolase [Deltaproteobacteria bacterium]
MSFDGALIFYPSLYPEGNWETQGRGSCAAEDVFFEAEDGVTTHGWFLKNESSDKVLVYYHGNAGSIADRFEWGCQLTQAGVSVLMVEYRGYGKSSGKPSEKGFYRDIEAVWQWLTGAAGFSSHDIVLYGKSLGGAVATELALR